MVGRPLTLREADQGAEVMTGAALRHRQGDGGTTMHSVLDHDPDAVATSTASRSDGSSTVSSEKGAQTKRLLEGARRGDKRAMRELTCHPTIRVRQLPVDDRSLILDGAQHRLSGVQKALQPPWFCSGEAFGRAPSGRTPRKRRRRRRINRTAEPVTAERDPARRKRLRRRSSTKEKGPKKKRVRTPPQPPDGKASSGPLERCRQCAYHDPSVGQAKRGRRKQQRARRRWRRMASPLPKAGFYRAPRGTQPP